MAAASSNSSHRRAGRPARWPDRAEYALTDQNLLTLSLDDGDMLRSESGDIWITRDGHLRDIVLASGAAHQVQGQARLHISAFGAARLVVIAGEPS